MLEMSIENTFNFFYVCLDYSLDTNNHVLVDYHYLYYYSVENSFHFFELLSIIENLL